MTLFCPTYVMPDLGKVLLLPKFGGLPQWAVVGEYINVTSYF